MSPLAGSLLTTMQLGERQWIGTLSLSEKALKR